MKIRRFGSKEEARRERIDDLVRLLDQPSAQERRPCAGCSIPCVCPKQSTECCCGCSADCPNISRELSSEPDSHPIEPGIAPLVYALSELRVVPPCWSCEGHLPADSRASRPPQVWFYSESTAYPELIAAHLARLQQLRSISKGWAITVCPHTECEVTTFTIRSEIDAELDPMQLRQLRKDVDCIAKSIRDGIRDIASRKLPSGRS